MSVYRARVERVPVEIARVSFPVAERVERKGVSAFYGSLAVLGLLGLWAVTSNDLPSVVIALSIFSNVLSLGAFTAVAMLPLAELVFELDGSETELKIHRIAWGRKRLHATAPFTHETRARVVMSRGGRSVTLVHGAQEHLLRSGLTEEEAQRVAADIERELSARRPLPPSSSRPADSPEEVEVEVEVARDGSLQK